MDFTISIWINPYHSELSHKSVGQPMVVPLDLYVSEKTVDWPISIWINPYHTELSYKSVGQPMVLDVYASE